MLRATISGSCQSATPKASLFSCLTMYILISSRDATPDNLLFRHIFSKVVYRSSCYQFSLKRRFVNHCMADYVTVDSWCFHVIRYAYCWIAIYFLRVILFSSERLHRGMLARATESPTRCLCNTCWREVHHLMRLQNEGQPHVTRSLTISEISATCRFREHSDSSGYLSTGTLLCRS